MSVSIIRHVTLVGFWVNAVLMVIKIAIGHYGHSDALVADGVHSLSDFATDLIVLAFVGIAYKGADSRHPYGHGKFETFASLLISVTLLLVAIGLGWAGVRAIISSLNGNPLPRPDIWTIAVAIIAILSKEWLYRYTIATGRRIDSSSLIANAWHHRSDAISSIATLIGVSSGYFLGEEWRIADPIVSIIIAFFIAWSAIGIGRPSVDELLERSLPNEKINEIEQAVASVDGVKAYHRLRTRRNGHSYLAELHIKVDPDITVTQGHDIATAVEYALRELLGQDSIITVHVEPYRNG
ncbi:cation diffusion facilitator family transporter [uncultured Duncaniella sp.]|uniref:cation diffusion facilitator family transporter n=1 Tax=uncultured Duncaniella sp. TaxID=2768039 RepID=UPI0025A97099|nr:cation diffusion facilitator family transporter [uncultured Duncaniella sp.]